MLWPHQKNGARKMGGCVGRDPTAVPNPFKESGSLGSQEVYQIIGIHEGLSCNDHINKDSGLQAQKAALSKSRSADNTPTPGNLLSSVEAGTEGPPGPPPT